MLPKNAITLLAMSWLLLPAVAVAQTPGKDDAPVKEKKICINGETTGSRLPRRVCKTLSEWKALLSTEEFADLEASVKQK